MDHTKIKRLRLLADLRLADRAWFNWVLDSLRSITENGGKASALTVLTVDAPRPDYFDAQFDEQLWEMHLILYENKNIFPDLEYIYVRCMPGTWAQEVDHALEETAFWELNRMAVIPLTMNQDEESAQHIHHP